jgi:hypothetical protein
MLEVDTLGQRLVLQVQDLRLQPRILGNGACIKNMHLQKLYIRYWPKLDMSLGVPSCWYLLITILEV